MNTPPDPFRDALDAMLAELPRDMTPSRDLWRDIQADIKIPLLIFLTFLLGLLPTWLIMRAKIWSMRRRIQAVERQAATPQPRPSATPQRRWTWRLPAHCSGPV